MKTISLTQGKVALVDDADYAAVSAFKWCAYKTSRGHFYAKRNVRKPDGKQHIQFLHHFLMPGVRVDHRDGDGLNNQRHNLRPATRQQNRQAFQRKKPDATSQFRGVTWLATDKKWQAQLGHNGRTFYLGRFADETEAAKAYDKAARERFGEFASLNFN